MRRTTTQMIQDSINEGYVMLSTGSGKYDEKVNEYRALNYDVRAWYVSSESDTKSWVLYGKQRVRKARQQRQQVVIYDFDSMNVKDLKKLCSQKKVAGYSKLKKIDMIERLKAVC